MQRLCEIGGIDAKTACRYWNMSNGMLLVVAFDAVEAVVQQLMGLGYAAQVAGPSVSLRGGGAAGWEIRTQL